MDKVCKHHGHTPHHWNSVRWKCNKCNVIAVKNHRLKKKKWAVEISGGGCKICQYDKCLGALEFHHRDPSDKTFDIGISRCHSYASLREELKKCDLLCANCHREIHEEMQNEDLHSERIVR